MLLNLRWLLVLAIGVVASSSAGAAEQRASPFVPKFDFSAPQSATVAAATRYGIPLEGIAIPRERADSQRGDCITMLVTLAEGKSAAQWLVQISPVDLTEKERQMPAPRTWHFYTTTGREFDFAGKLAALEIRMIGPLKGTEGNDEKAVLAAKDQKVRVLVNSEFLRLGFDRACAAWLRMQAANAHNEALKGVAVNWGCNTAKFTPERVVAGKRIAELLGMKEDDERALAGTTPALIAFFEIVINAPELRDILRQVADLPWWQLVKHGGQPQIDVQFITPFVRGAGEDWRLPAGEAVWCLPLVFNLYGKPVVACRLAATAPKPPLLTSAGIIGIAAQRPDGQGPHLMLQVLATRCADDKSEKIGVK